MVKQMGKPVVKPTAKPRQSKRPAKNLKIPSPSPVHSELYGLVLLAAACTLFLSVLGFQYGRPNDHFLGVIGYSLGGVTAYLFGISGYWLALVLAWVGWKKLWNQQIIHPIGRLFAGLIFLISANVLVNLTEELYPEWSGHFSSLPVEPSWAPLKLPNGGAPVYSLSKKWPQYSLHRLFNTAGIFLFFSSLAFISFLSFTQLRLLPLFMWVRRQLQKDPLPVSSEVSTPQPTQTESEPTSLWRYVRVRLGETVQGKQESSSTQGAPAPGLLAIRPEKDLKTRPSISGKQEVPVPLAPPRKELFKAPLKENPVAQPKPVAVAAVTKPKAQGAATPLKLPRRKENGLNPAQDLAHYKLPASGLLTDATRFDTSTLKQDLRRQAEVLEETLHSFGIEAKVGDINCGPTITSFEVHPAIGVKVQKIKALENDIALNMEARSIRIIAPIPGKAAVGIEVPNAKPQEVSFKEMLQAYQANGSKFRIPILLGKAVNGDYVMSDLTKMPHCIIAGATGSGKSVCINTIVMSIVFNARPDQIRLLMVDPKKVELTPYTNLPHMLAPVITEPKGACAALHWLVKEMEKRYDWLKLTGVRNIESFNHRKSDPEGDKALDPDLPVHLPYIVAIIDELADLMMVSSHDIETPIARIAQMARAVGIHLILATQRPSREVITGIIKANFPTRISFKVSSRVNSQIILDESGAESLLGNGDMLFLPPASSHLVRAQGSYVRDEDIQSVIQTICSQMPTQYLIPSFDELAQEMEGKEDEEDEKPVRNNQLFNQAVALVQSKQKASATFLQQRLKIGYPTAARLMDELEEEGIISPVENGKMRRVLSNPEESIAPLKLAPQMPSLRDIKLPTRTPPLSVKEDDLLDDESEDEQSLTTHPLTSSTFKDL